MYADLDISSFPVWFQFHEDASVYILDGTTFLVQVSAIPELVQYKLRTNSYWVSVQALS